MRLCIFYIYRCYSFHGLKLSLFEFLKLNSTTSLNVTANYLNQVYYKINIDFTSHCLPKFPLYLPSFHILATVSQVQPASLESELCKLPSTRVL